MIELLSGARRRRGGVADRGPARAPYHPHSDREQFEVGARPLRLLTFTTLYPNAANENHGVFVENRLRHLVADGRVTSTVLAPVPFFPSAAQCFGGWARYAAAPPSEVRHGISIHHPRFVAIPRVGMVLNPLTLFHAAVAAVERLLAAGAHFDAIDAHFLYPDGVAAVRLGRHFGIPVVLTARGSDASLLPSYRIPRERIQAALAAADGVVAVSEGLKAGLVAIGTPAARVTVLRNGVDLQAFRPVPDRAAARRALGVSGPVLLAVGQLIERKRHDRTIEAMRSLPGHTLLIVGEGPERVRLTRLAATLGVADQVRLAGPCPHERLREVYAAADVLVLSSSREGWANVLLESMACGTPVVTTPTWGAREAVLHLDAGLVLDGWSSGVIAAGVRTVLSTTLDRAATRRYAERFDWGETTVGQVELFERVVAARR